MTSKNFSSKGLLGDSLRRNLWGFVLGGVGFFLSLLLPLLMTMQRALENRAQNLKEFPEMVDYDWQRALENVADLLGGGNFFVKTALVVMAIVCGVVMFAYLHSRQKVDFYHSLPISRTRLFVNNFLTGILLTLLPYLVMLVIAVACTFGMGFSAAFDGAAVISALVSQMILFLTIYALSVLTTVICGNTVISLLLLAWVHLSPMLARFLFAGLCEKFYSTYYFAMSTENIQQTVRLSPLVEMYDINGFSFNFLFTSRIGMEVPSAGGLLLAYLVVAVLATALALWLFRIRRSERAGVALAFSRVKLPLKVYMCLFMGVAFGMVFGVIAGDFWFWVGLVIGTVLTHWIVEIVYAFDFHAIFGKPLHLVVILAVLFAGMLCMKFDVTGYDTWLPARNDIQAVSVNGDASEMLSDESNIDAAYRLAEIGCEANADALREQGNYQGITLRFQLSGRTAIRYFTLPDDEEVNALAEQIYATEEYKRVTWPLFRVDLDAQDGQGISLDVFTNESSYGIAATISMPDAVQQILTTLREESLDRKENGLPVLRLDINMVRSDGGLQYEGEAYVTAEDTKTLALIEEITGVKPATLSAENVDLINLRYNYQYGDSNNYYYSETVQVTDPADIAALLQNACNRDSMDLYSQRDAVRNGFAVDSHTDSMDIEARISQKGSEDWCQLIYAEGDWPEEIIEKYRPEGDAVENSTVASEAGGAVSTGMVG